MLRSVLILVFFIFASISAQAAVVLHDANHSCGAWCAELTPYGDTYLQRIRDGAGVVISVEKTSVPSDTVLESIGPVTRDSNGSAPQPPAGGSGTVTETSMGNGTSGGQMGVWVSTSTWTFLNHSIVSVTSTNMFFPGLLPR